MSNLWEAIQAAQEGKLATHSNGHYIKWDNETLKAVWDDDTDIIALEYFFTGWTIEEAYEDVEVGGEEWLHITVPNATGHFKLGVSCCADYPWFGGYIYEDMKEPSAMPVRILASDGRILHPTHVRVLK